MTLFWNGYVFSFFVFWILRYFFNESILWINVHNSWRWCILAWFTLPTWNHNTSLCLLPTLAEYNLEIIVFLMILIFLFTAWRHILIWPLALPVNLLCFSSQSVTSWVVHHRPANLALRSRLSPRISAAPCTNGVSFAQTVSVALWENNWQRAQRYKKPWTFSSLHPFFFVQCRKMSVSTTEPSTRCDSSETVFFLFSLSMKVEHSLNSNVTQRCFLTCMSACLQPGMEFEKDTCTRCRCTNQRDPKTIEENIICFTIDCSPCAVVTTACECERNTLIFWNF